MAAQTGSGASVSATREYDAFGGVASSSGSWQGPFGAAGAFGYQTEASGLHLLGHRYYDASLGRFLSRDPIGDGSNWYAYCGNDPVAFADPAGEVAWFIIAGILIAGAALFDLGRRYNEEYEKQRKLKQEGWDDSYERFADGSATGDEWRDHGRRIAEGAEAARILALEELKGQYYRGPMIRSGGAVLGGGLLFRETMPWDSLDDAVGAAETIVEGAFAVDGMSRR
jgi:RHS repeat-associated protein